MFPWCVALFLLAASWALPVAAQEYIRSTTTAPDSVEQLAGPIDVAFADPEPPSTALLGALEEALKPLPPFLSDTTLDANIRTYYFFRDNGDTVPSALQKNEAWAGGGSVRLQSGLLWKTLSVGGEYFTSIPIDAPDSRPGTGLLKPIQDTISVFGQAYVRGTFGKQVVTLGRQRYELPHLNGLDSRMVPNTFLGYSIDGRWPHGRFVAGYIDQIKLRASDKFIPMSRAAGVANSDEGLFILGMRYEWHDNFVGAIASVVPDVMSTVYSELDTRWSFGEWGFRLGAQLTDQRSVGDNLLTGGSFDTQSGGVRLATSYRNAILTTSFTVVSDGARIRSPFGGDPSFSSLMLSDFNLANQKTFKVGFSYDGARIGLASLSAFLNYARGLDAQNAAMGGSLPDNEEIDLTLDFRPEQAPFRGVWLRLRAGVLDPGKDRRRYNVRATFNWSFALL